jgi:hypothetical protein
MMVGMKADKFYKLGRKSSAIYYSSLKSLEFLVGAVEEYL